MERKETYQMNLFEATYEKPILPKHIRLIEFFAGIGSQAKALEILGADFEHWRVSEWSIHSIIAYDAIHFGDFSDKTGDMTYEEVLSYIKGVSADYNQPMDEKQLRKKGESWARRICSAMQTIHDFKPNVCDVHAEDLGIRERERNTYILTYSFPCQDLSSAGLQKGMSKGSGTRSGLLWEVERILNECKSTDCLPQVLIMENVPAVCGSANLEPWNDWLDALEGLGYTNYHKIINAKDFGIPQNRKRCFMVSVLGNFSFSFPKKQRLEYRLKDFIKKDVDGSYYLSDKLVESFKEYTVRNKEKGNGFGFKPKDGGKEASTITTREGQRTCDNFLFDTIDQYNKSIHKDPESVGTIQAHYSTSNHGERLLIPSATEKGFMEAKEGDGVIPTWKGARGTVQGGGGTDFADKPGKNRGGGQG